jgi:hypothetical protein
MIRIIDKAKNRITGTINMGGVCPYSRNTKVLTGCRGEGEVSQKLVITS